MDRQCKTNNLHMDRQCKKTTAIYIWTVHIYRLYRRQCAKYTYMYSVRLVYYRDILNYQRHIIHRMGTSTLCTVSIHNVVIMCQPEAIQNTEAKTSESTTCLNAACDRITYTGDYGDPKPLKWPNWCPHQSRCITWRVFDISCSPTQPFSGSSNPPPARHWRAHLCPLPHCHITSVCCWRSPHPPKCGFVTTNHGSSHVRPIRTFHFLHGPKHILRAPHAPLCQAHAASARRCSHVCPWATHCAKACSTSQPKGDYADTRTRCTMRRTPRCQGHLWKTQASGILAWHAARRSRIH